MTYLGCLSIIGAMRGAGSTYDGPPEIKLRRVMAILEQARLPEHDKAIRQLGVGPFEDMMSHWLLDHLEAYMPFNDTLRHALEGLYIFNEPQAVQDRLARMMKASEKAARIRPDRDNQTRNP
jgi:hypothetical protein